MSVDTTMSQVSGCCGTIDDGSQVCDVSQHEKGTACQCQPAQTSKVVMSPIRPQPLHDTARWSDLRSGAMFVIACIASPCCTPLIVPAFLALIAGTPLAVWMGANLGWVYGGLTLLSVTSLLLAFRRMSKGRTHQTRPLA